MPRDARNMLNGQHGVRRNMPSLNPFRYMTLGLANLPCQGRLPACDFNSFSENMGHVHLAIGCLTNSQDICLKSWLDRIRRMLSIRRDIVLW